MQETGTLVAQLVTSAARIPLFGATLAITQTQPDGTQTLLAVRLSDYDGFTAPFTLSTPPAADSTTRQQEKPPYTQVDLLADCPGYDRILVRGVQIFPGIRSIQQLDLIPTPTLPQSYTQTQEFSIPAQLL